MISVCMIVKNEIDLLERCISSIKEKLSRLVDEILVVDTGSTDGTRELATKLGCKVYDFEWCNDFSKARNFSLEKSKNDWVIIMDADEFVGDVDLAGIKEFAQEKNKRYIGEGPVIEYSDNEMESFVVSVKSRMFNKKEVGYKYIIHEIPVMEDGAERNYVTLPIEVHHTGYIEEIVKSKSKLERNLELVKKSLEEEYDVYLVMHLGKTYIGLEKYKEALECLKEVLDNKDVAKFTFYSDTAREYVRCFIKASMFEEGMVCEEYWETCKHDDGYVYMMGHLYFRNGYFEKAMDCFIDVINREQSCVNKKDALYSLGQMFSVLGLHEESANYFEMCGDFSDAKEWVYNERKKHDL